MPGLVDGAGLVDRPVVHPDDDVAPRLAGGADGDRPALAIEGDQRAGRVEADACDRLRRDARLGHRIAGRLAAGRPDVVGGLLDDVARLAPHLDSVLGRSQKPAVGGEDSGARAAGADVNADENPLHAFPAAFS